MAINAIPWTNHRGERGLSSIAYIQKVIIPMKDDERIKRCGTASAYIFIWQGILVVQMTSTLAGAIDQAMKKIRQ